MLDEPAATNLPGDAVASREVRRALIDAIGQRLPTGLGVEQRSVKKARRVPADAGARAILEGATPAVCLGLGVPPEWADRCEDSAYAGHDATVDALARRLEKHIAAGTVRSFPEKIAQLGSYGGGNHFGECETVRVNPAADPAVVETFSLRDGHVAFLSHCGSRGFGNVLADRQFHALDGFLTGGLSRCRPATGTWFTRRWAPPRLTITWTI